MSEQRCVSSSVGIIAVANQLQYCVSDTRHRSLRSVSSLSLSLSLSLSPPTQIILYMSMVSTVW